MEYREFIKQGMRLMGLKGATVETVRLAMRELAKEWVRRKITNTVPTASAREVADRLLGK